MSISRPRQIAVELGVQVQTAASAAPTAPRSTCVAGENVCIQATTPTQRRPLFASRMCRRIPSGSVTTGWWTIRTGIAATRSSAAASCARARRRPAQDLVAVERLAPGDEPDLQLVERLGVDARLRQRGARAAGSKKCRRFTSTVRRDATTRRTRRCPRIDPRDAACDRHAPSTGAGLVRGQSPLAPSRNDGRVDREVHELLVSERLDELDVGDEAAARRLRVPAGPSDALDGCPTTSRRPARSARRDRPARERA